MKLIDTHAHLDEVKDVEGALARAREAGLRAIVGVGTDFVSNEKILRLADRFPGFVLPALGLHPWKLEGADPEAHFRLIERELPRCVGLGEVGLDFAIRTSRETQQEVLETLLTLAFRGRKPVLLHARRAWGEALGILQSSGVEKAVFHWYSGPSDILAAIMAGGYFISATPAAAYSEKHRQAIRECPLDRLLLETDCPEVYRGKVSEPKEILTALGSASEVRGMAPEEIARQVYRNSLEFFQIPDPRGD